MNFIPSINSGIHPTNISENPTTTQLAHAQPEHSSYQQEWKDYNATDDALKQQSISATPDLNTVQ